jgi:hypothetical protein
LADGEVTNGAGGKNASPGTFFNQKIAMTKFQAGA